MKITNLKEFLAHVSGENAYHAGRNLYKYTSCGPWIVYLVEETPEQSVSLGVQVRMKDGKLHASCEESIFDYENERAPDVLDLLGFHPEGSPRKSDKIGRSVAAYRRTIEAFIKRDRRDNNNAPATMGDSSKPYTLTLYPQRPTELGCRPAPKAVNILMHRIEKPVYREVYYESDEANTLTECAGIKMGSIVEGSEAYVDREPMMFPFTTAEFDSYVKSIDDEADFFWKRDNLDHYRVMQGKKEYYITAGWGEELKLPKKLREAVTAFLQNNELEEGPTITIPDTKIEIEKLSTDGCGY